MKPKTPFPRVMVAVALGCLAFPFGVVVWNQTHPPTPPFKFPSAELAALDRDLQARFAVVPDKDFGIERAYGNQHYLYNPETPAERQTIAALHKQQTDAAFYLMSRALWLRSWDSSGYKPIQGPVAITGKIDAPIPRAIHFSVDKRPSSEGILSQQNAASAESNGKEGLPTHLPNGQTVPSPTPPSGAPPGVDELQALGNTVFEMAEHAPKTAKVGTSTTWKGWKVVAVPIRANQKACLPCHTYQPLISGKLPGRTKLEVGDALGVAFYAYRKKRS